MEQLEQVLKEILNDKLIRIIISNPRKATEPKKMEVRPFLEKGGLFFQFSVYRNNQVFHGNYDRDSAYIKIMSDLKENYRQMEIWHDSRMIHVLVSKKGKVTVKEKLWIKSIKNSDR